MTLMMRITRLFKADIHELLDGLEEPEAVLKQAIRDMRHEIEQGEQILADLSRKEAKQQAVCQRLEDQMTELEEQIEICFEADNEDLARSVIRKKLETERRLRVAQQAAADLSARKDAHDNTLKEQKTQLQVIVDKMQTIMETEAPGRDPTPVDTAESARFTVSDEEVEIAFVREKRQRADRIEE